MPAMTVIIPCYNDGATLPETLASVRDQGAAEIIVVDDGSTDAATIRLMDELRCDPAIRVIHRENGGLAAARMSGVHAATSELIAPVDADDVVAPGALRRLAEAFDIDAELSVAFGDIELFGTISGRLSCDWGWDPWLICHVNLVPGAASVIRRSHLIADGGWVIRGGYEDWDLWMSMLEAGRSARYVPGTVLYYRQGAGRMLSASRTRHADLFGQAHDRHPALFAAQARHRRLSRAPWRMRIGIRLVDAMPVSNDLRHRIKLFLAWPTRGVSVRAQRLRTRVSRRSRSWATP